MTWGILRPVVLLPSDASEWTPERRRVVLAHELGHVKRNDGLGQVLCQCASGIYWFNPLVWYAAHRLRVEREHACDDIVLRLGAGAADYAEHLLQIARRLNSGLSWTVVSMANPSQLKARLVAILDKRIRRKKLSRLAAAGLTALIVCLTVSAAVIQITALASMSVHGLIAPMTPMPPPVESPRQVEASQQPISVVPGAAIVEGTVQKAGGTDVIGGAAVELRPALSRSDLIANRGNGDAGVFVVTADEKGLFKFANVPPGQYSLAATHFGYVRSEYGQSRQNSRGANFTLQAGQQMKGIVLPMTATAVISGQVRGPKGLPLANVQVHALKYGYEDGRRVLQTARVMRTNDEGEYRLYWMPPGQYVVMAIPLFGGVDDRVLIVGGDGTVRGFSGILPVNGPPIVLPDEAGNVPIYYPGTLRVEDATVITLKTGEERTGIDLALRPLPVSRVRGTVLNLPPNVAGNAAGPPTMASIRLQPTTPSVLEGNSAPLGMGSVDLRSGTFEIRGVLPGTYNLLASAMGGGRSGTSLFARMPVEVTGSDLDDVRVTLAPGFVVTARVSVEGAKDDTALTKLLPLRVALNGSVAQPDPSQPGVFVARDLPPNLYRVRVDRLETSYVKAIRYREIDVMDAGITLNAPPTGPIDITISLSAGVITGTALAADGKPAPNAAVVLIPDPSRRKRSDLYKSVFSGADGTFRLTGITPGDYKLFSWRDVDNGAWGDPEFIKDYEEQGKPIRVGEGSATTIQVIAIP
jgi:hypothetical protein